MDESDAVVSAGLDQARRADRVERDVDVAEELEHTNRIVDELTVDREDPPRS